MDESPAYASSPEIINNGFPLFYLQSSNLSSIINFNSACWLMFGMQLPSLQDSTQDSTFQNSFNLPQQNEPDRLSGEHPKTNFAKKNPKGIKQYSELDSTTDNINSREFIDKFEVGNKYDINIDDYVKLRKKMLQYAIWDSLMERYDLKQALSGGDLARLLAQSTGLTIPVPPNPIMSIFGKPQISINVNGEVNMTLGWRWDSQNKGTVSAFGQTQSTPIFSQDIRVNVTAKIGDKLKMSTDWNTHQQFEFNNKFKIGYEGEDDEIIKLIEVGNVTMPIPSTLISGGEALFGVRADFQFGPLFLKTIFSQKRGEQKFIDVRGGSSQLPFTLRAYDYAKNHFFIDTAYRSVFRDYFKYTTPTIPASASSLRVGEIEVWESTNVITDAAMYSNYAVAFADLPSIKLQQGGRYPVSMKKATAQAGTIVQGSFIKLDSTRYEINYNLGTLTILNMKQDRNYAIAYRAEGPLLSSDDDDYFGTLLRFAAVKDTLILKLIYVNNMVPSYKTLWSRQMKNIYSINATNVSLTDTKIGIWYINQSNDSTDVLPGAPDKVVTILGVDRVTNGTQSPPPDGQFDLQPPYFNAIRGEIMFPSLEPFRQGLRDYFTAKGTPQLAENFVFNEVYDTTDVVARLNTSRDRFIVAGTVTGSATNRIPLNTFNLAPGSVKVTLDGNPLREFEDYVVDYYSGMLTLRNPRALLPNANVKISYEAQDVFNISTRTLAGIRGDYQVVKSRNINSSFGFTIMHYNQSAIIDRVRLGEEPVSNTMLGIDGKLQYNTPWLTKILDKLPFYDTKAPSSLQVRGELASSISNPNTRTSDVASDNGEPVVYLDDFEGAQRYITLGLTATQWSHASQPEDSLIALTDSARATFRGKSYWYQYFIPKVPVRQVYPQKDVVIGNSNLSPLYINFDPEHRGIYTRNLEYLDPDDRDYDSTNIFSKKPENRQRIWGGMMRLFSSFNTNFDTENIDYIEIMMNITAQDVGSTKMFIDLGQISEDIIPNLRLDTEDGITAANPVPNGIIDPGEDIGIDAQDDAAEKMSGLYPVPKNPNGDPARDDYHFDFSKDDNTRNDADFVNYNNFEGNSLVAETGQFPDTEILNKNNGQSISLTNSYFEYEVNLNADPNTNPQIVGGGSNGWYLYRIPIRKPTILVGNPQFSNIQYIRVWFKGGTFQAAIADWRLLGAQWQRINNLQDVAVDDSVLQVAFVNVEENSGAPDYYGMPPGVQAPRQLANPDPNQDIKLNEQSLSLSVKNLRYGEERLASKIVRQLDVFYYKYLKFFIHGDGSMPDNIVPGAIPKAYAFLRFGVDSANYYEYRRPLIKGWQDINIVLTQLTAIKQGRDTTKITERQVFAVTGDPLATFTIKGNPILTRVEFFAFGISNPAERYPNELTTTMWVDELRLVSPEHGTDWAGVANIDLKLADLGTMNASISHTQPNFHGLEERFGNRISATNWNVTMQGNLEKFAPVSFKNMRIPISYSHSEFMQDPEFVANNDINLTDAANTAAENAKLNALKNGKTPQEAQTISDATRVSTLTQSQTLRVQDSWALTGVKLGIPISNWLIDDTFNKMVFGYSYSQEYERSPIDAQKFTWQWIFTSQYTLQIPVIPSIQPLKWASEIPVLDFYKDEKINFSPSSFSAGLKLDRERITEQSRFLDFPSPVFRQFNSLQQAQFSWKFAEQGFLNPVLDYSVATGSTLVPFELDENGLQRTGSQIASLLFFKNGKIFDFGKNNTHTQTVTINFKPKLPLGSVSTFIDMTGSYQNTYSWLNPLQPDEAIADIVKSANWKNSIRFNTAIRLKALTDQWFNPGFNPRAKRLLSDTTGLPPDDLAKKIAKIFKTIFLDFEKFDITFTQSNNSINPGIMGGTGITNFWAWTRPYNNIYGPSMAYQLGLVEEPHGGFNIVSSKSFPFFGFNTYTGLRPPNAVLQDNFNQKTNFDIKTSRPLWKGAVLDLTWSTEFGYNKNQTVLTDNFGNPTFTNVIALESINRTYLTLPPLFGINLTRNTIEHVVALYRARSATITAANPTDTLARNQQLRLALAQSFTDGLELFRIFGGKAANYLPALNWSIRWDGIEKWGIWNGLLKNATIEHVYSSKYNEIAQVNDLGRDIQNQQVQVGFQPLIGINVGYNEDKLKGILTTTLRLNTTTTYQLSSASGATIAKQTSTEIQAQGNYTMKGFEFPLLGLTLKNDVEGIFFFSYKSNKSATYDVLNFDSESGRQLNGSTTITLEPRIRYTMSNRVKASFFVRYEGTTNEGAAAPGFSTTQVGLDISISIAGGR
ncbi:MAG: cell surface protein SprA [FCB group bacterium]